jgi:myo-inositol-1(or 4)-monophosphatase
VDKKLKRPQNLADFLKSHLESVKNLVVLHQKPVITIKADGSPVTTLDLALSQYIENILVEKFPQSVFYSEENFSGWGFPLMALDPLDGTREFMKARPEWAVSLGYLENEDWVGEGWIYNPMTDEVFSGEKNLIFKEKDSYQGEVSHSEWEQNLYQNCDQTKFQLRPMGSIAYKLGKLSEGKTDFVVSLRDKNIWDISAGTLLCEAQGIHFYSKGKRVTKVLPFYEAPLLWCPQELSVELLRLYS